MPEDGGRLVRDPIYGYVEISPRLAPLVDHPLTQRLRRVGQTSLTQTVYPAATGSRFEHALGVMYLARRAWSAAWANTYGGERVREKFMRAVAEEIRLPGVNFAGVIGDAVAAVGLLHDVGHPPFSHVLEGVFAHQASRSRWLVRQQPRWIRVGDFHEFAGVILLEQIAGDLEPQKDADKDLDFFGLVRAIYEANPADRDWKGALHSIVAGEVDVDRLDYLMRDGQKAGTEFGAIDFERLVDALELHTEDKGFRIAPGVRARSAVETLLVQRAQAYRWIIYHSRVVGANLSLARAVEALLDLAHDPRTIELPEQGELTLGELFAPTIPMLNYVEPRPADLAATHRSAPHWRLTEQRESQLLRSIARSMQSFVDDASILHGLQSAYLLAASLLEQADLPSDVVDRLSRFAAYVRAAVLRERNFVSAWKTVDEFNRATERFGDSPESDDSQPATTHDSRIADAIRTVYDEVIQELLAESPQRARQAEGLTIERDARLRRLASSPAAEINDIFATLLSGSEERQLSLRQLLNDAKTEFRANEGFWEVAFAAFRPLASGEKLAVLYHGSIARSVRRTSPLVEALEKLEESRVRLFIYFFVTTPDLARWREEHLERSRATLIAAFYQTLPDFLVKEWPAFIHLSLRAQAAE